MGFLLGLCNEFRLFVALMDEFSDLRSSVLLQESPNIRFDGIYILIFKIRLNHSLLGLTVIDIFHLDSILCRSDALFDVSSCLICLTYDNLLLFHFQLQNPFHLKIVQGDLVVLLCQHLPLRLPFFKHQTAQINVCSNSQ